MDVIKSRNKSTSIISKKHFLTVGSVVLIIFSVLLMNDPGNSPSASVERKDIRLAKVNRGSLKVTIDGYGVLRSRKQTLLTAQTPATVEEVLLRPGAKISKGSVILRLSRPQLLQELEASKLALKQEKANLQRLILSNRRELLEQKALKVDLDAEIQMASLLKEAQHELAKSGIISSLAYKQAELDESKKKQKLDILNQRVEQLQEELNIAVAVQQEQVKIAQSRTDSIAQQAEQLTVKATIDGVLQRLPVELGQSVAAGQELALIGTDTDLVALVQVPQSKAEQLKIGQTATINTRKDKAKGQLVRIAPQVVDGTVEVEIAFIEDIPRSARPELNIDVEIYAAEVSNALYIERPFNAQANNVSQLFKLVQNDRAVKQEIKFGLDSGRYIQLIDGAVENDNLIISDMSNFNSEPEVSVLN